MSTFSIFLALIIIVSVLLVIVIMVQNPKGGGLSSSFGGGGAQQVGGVKNTSTFLDKATWTLATVLLVLVLLSNVSIMGGDSSKSRIIDESNTPTAPAPQQNRPSPNSGMPSPGGGPK